MIVWVSSIQRARPQKEQAPQSLQEAVAILHVELPGFEFGVATQGECLKELFNGDSHKIGRLNEDMAPHVVGIPAELTESRGSNSRELTVSFGVNMNNEYFIDVRDACLYDLSRKKLLPEELVKGLIEVVLNLRGDGEVDRRVASIVEFPI